MKSNMIELFHGTRVSYVDARAVETNDEIVTIVCRKWAYICRNNGQFHKGDMQNRAGYATFLGKVLKSDLEV